MFVRGEKWELMGNYNKLLELGEAVHATVPHLPAISTYAEAW